MIIWPYRQNKFFPRDIVEIKIFVIKIWVHKHQNLIKLYLECVQLIALEFQSFCLSQKQILSLFLQLF